jgi:hypothetical protein
MENASGQLSVFVHPLYRRLGLGGKVIKRLIHDYNIDKDTVMGCTGESHDVSRAFYGSLNVYYAKDGCVNLNDEEKTLMIHGKLKNIRQVVKYKRQKEKGEVTNFDPPFIIKEIGMSTYFNVDADGAYIGYHVEGGETLSRSTQPPLSMKTLKNDKPLFLCNNPDEWYPKHLSNSNCYRVYKVRFSPVKSAEFTRFDTYHKVFDVIENNGVSNTTLSRLGKSWSRFNIELFTLLPSNDKDEISEAFLMNSRNKVLSIELLH